MSDDEESYEYEYDDDDDDDDDGQNMDEDQDDDDDNNNNDDDDDEDGFEYTDDEEEADDGEVALENAYYNSKGLREDDLQEAAESFEQVILQEQQEIASSSTSSQTQQQQQYGIWSFKSMKQLVKLHLRSGNYTEMMKQYHRLLECIAQGVISPNAVEKGINGMLERVSALYQGVMSSGSSSGSNMMVTDEETTSMSTSTATALTPQQLALQVYDATLQVFRPISTTTTTTTSSSSSAFPNERLWFKTNLKYGQLLYEMNETEKLQRVLKDLKSLQPDDGNNSISGTTSTNSSNNTQSMEVYALQIQLYSRQKEHKKLREVFHKAMNVRGGIPHPRTLALIQELGGKMHMASKEYEAAGKTFFQAFKSYDEAGDSSRLRCLKYLVLASMLHASTINPFDSQEARPYRDDPEITAMTNLVQAFHNNDITSFEKILQHPQTRRMIMNDEFVRERIEDLLRTIRTQVLRRVIRPYTRMSLTAIAKELNHISLEEVESLLVNLILSGKLEGQIDQVQGILIKQAEKGPAPSAAEVAEAEAAAAAATEATTTTTVTSSATSNIIDSTSLLDLSNPSSTNSTLATSTATNSIRHDPMARFEELVTDSEETRMMKRKYKALQQIANCLDEIGQKTSAAVQMNNPIGTMSATPSVLRTTPTTMTTSNTATAGTTSVTA